MTEDELLALVGAHDNSKRARLIEGGRLVHYTSAEAAYRIITGAQVWLRSAAMMNDFSEISHGLNCLYKAWQSPQGIALQELLERVRPGLRTELATLFDNHAENLARQTYIMSLSDHDDCEDQLGRLSMWRAYGGRSGVALVLNPRAFTGSSEAMSVYSSPVLYEDESSFLDAFRDWTQPILDSEMALCMANPDTVKNVLFMMFRIFVMCTKHPGFREEREWRIFWSPVHEKMSKWIEFGIEIIKGTPQPLAKLKLIDDESLGIEGAEPRTLINRVIIGPCEYPLQVRAAMYEAMERAQIDDISSKLSMSLIPLRQS
jgi:hypothetical protein